MFSVWLLSHSMRILRLIHVVVLIFCFFLLRNIITQYHLAKSREPDPCGLVTIKAIKGDKQPLWCGGKVTDRYHGISYPEALSQECWEFGGSYRVRRRNKFSEQLLWHFPLSPVPEDSKCCREHGLGFSRHSPAGLQLTNRLFLSFLFLAFCTTFAHLLSSGSVLICHNILKLNGS